MDALNFYSFIAYFFQAQTSKHIPYIGMLYSSVVDPNTLNLDPDPDPGFWPNLDPDPG